MHRQAVRWAKMIDSRRKLKRHIREDFLEGPYGSVFVRYREGDGDLYLQG